MRLWRVLQFSLIALAIAPSAASAADIHVTTGGTDSPTCGDVGTPCATIAQALTNASASGDVVRVGNGTFLQAATLNPGAKSVEIVGNGIDSTRISGGDSNTFASGGLIRFSNTGMTVAVRNLSLVDLPRTAGASNRYGIWVQPAPSNPANAIDAEITNVRVVGDGVFATQSENAVYAANNKGSVTISDSIIENASGNSILLERQSGAVTVENSVLSKPQTNTSPLIFDMLHGGPDWNQTGLHQFVGNTFNTPGAIRVTGGFAFATSPAASAFPVGVTIADNTFNTGAAATTVINLTNSRNADDGSAGQIDNVSITGNTIGGAGAGTGISLTGGVPGALIEGNDIRNRATAISLTRWTASFLPPPNTFAHVPAGAVINSNQIVGNGIGIFADAGATIDADATGNWWGCNEGPGQPGCDTVSQPAAGIDFDPWAVLRLTPDTPSLGVFGSSGLVAGIDGDSDGGATGPLLPDGSLIGFGGAGGIVTPASGATSSSLAGSTFFSTGPSGRQASATYDNETVTHTWADADTTPPVIDILTPLDNTTVGSDVAETTLTYLVGDFGDPSPTCTPASGSSVALAPGANTILVTCTDASGNVGTSSVTVTRASPPPPPAPIDALPQCARDVIITNVVIKSRRYSQVSGVARTRFAGRTVRINYRPSGTRTVGRAVVRADGTWSVTVRRPAKPSVGSNSARYRAVLGSARTNWIKLSRRLVTGRISYSGGRLNISGRVIRPIAPGQRLTVTRSDLCGRYRTIGTLAVARNGKFSGSVATTPRADSQVPFVRLRVKVRRGGRSNPNREFTTYSIVRPVTILP